jgi:hypothetical protein
MVSKTQLILQHMQEEGPISGLEAMQRYNLYRLSSSIHSLRKQGHLIVTEMVKRHNDVEYAQYILINSDDVEKGDDNA